MVIGTFVSKGHYVEGLISLSVIMFICVVIAMFIPEEKIEKENVAPLDWQPFIRLILMTAVFTGLTLGIGLLIQWAVPYFDIQSKILIGAMGIFGMIIASVLGVIISTRISFGNDKHLHISLIAWIINRLFFFIASHNMTSFMTYYFMEKYPEISSNEAAGLTAKILPFVAIGMVLAAIPSGFFGRSFRKEIVALYHFMYWDSWHYYFIKKHFFYDPLFGWCFNWCCDQFLFQCKLGFGHYINSRRTSWHLFRYFKLSWCRRWNDWWLFRWTNWRYASSWFYSVDDYFGEYVLFRQ